jgi:hypothetical protein
MKIILSLYLLLRVQISYWFKLDDKLFYQKLRLQCSLTYVRGSPYEIK